MANLDYTQDINLTITTQPDIQMTITSVGGPRGDDGYTPIKGVDYFDGAKGDPGVAGTTDHLALTNIGTNTHAQIDTKLASLQTGLDTKAGLVHTHSIADVGSLQTTLDAKVTKTGTETISGVKTHTAQINVNVGAGNITGINMLGSKIVTLAAPVGTQDAVNKAYADALISAPNQQYKTTFVVGLGKVDYVLPNTDAGNRAQIQAAIDAAAATSAGGKVLINMPVVTIDGPLTLKSNVEICFANRNGTLKLANGANTGIFTTALANLNNLYVHDMTLDGNYANQTGNTSQGQAMFYIGGGGLSTLENILIENVTMKDSWKHCFFISGDNNSQNTKVIRNCKIMRHGMGSVGFGLYTDYAPGTIFYGNRIEQSGEPSGVGDFNDAIEIGHLGATAMSNSIDGGQLQFPFGDNSLIVNNVLHSNTIQNDGNTANNVIIIGNRVKNATPITGFGGISVTGADAIIANNHVKSNAFHGIRSYGSGHVISGNRVDGVSKDGGNVNGIYADSSSYSTISSNRVKNFNKAITLVEDYNVVTGNTVESCNVGIDLAAFSSSAHTMVGNQVYGNILDGATTKISINGQTTGLAKIQGVVSKDGDTMTGDLSVPDEVYGSAWNGSLEVPTKNALYDKIETIIGENTPDATTSTKGIVQLAGDLGGTSASPTTPTAVHLTGNETIAGTKTFSNAIALGSGGTGSTTAPGAFTNIKQNASTSSTGVIQLAGDLGGNATTIKIKRTTTKTVATIASGLLADYYTDGVDDQIEIAQALSAVSTAGGGQVTVLEGTYSINAIVNIPSNIELIGINYKTILNATAIPNAVFKAQSVSNIRIAGFTIDNNARAVMNSNGLYMQDVTDVIVENNRFLNQWGFGIFLTSVGTFTTKNVWIRQNYLYGKGNNDVIGGGPANSTGAIVKDVFVEQNIVIQDSTTGRNHKDAINFVAANRIQFSSNIVEGSILFGSEQQPHKSALIQNNIIKNAIGALRAAVGFVIDPAGISTGEALIISGNTVESGFIDLYSNPTTPLSTNTIVSNNVIRAVGVTGTTGGEAGIRAVNFDGLIVSNNSVYSSSANGIWLTGTINSLITGNIVRDSTGWGIQETGTSDNNGYYSNKLINNTLGNFSLLGTGSVHFSNDGGSDAGALDSLVLHKALNEVVTGNKTFTPTTNSTSTIRVTKQDGTSEVLNIDTSNTRIGIGKASPAFGLDVNADTRSGGSITAGVGVRNTAGSTASNGTGISMYYHTGGYGVIEAGDWGAAVKNIRLNPAGGSIGIGKDPSTLLDVNGTVTALGANITSTTYPQLKLGYNTGTSATQGVTVNGHYVVDGANMGVRTATPSSTLHVGGSFATPLTTKTAAYTVSATDYTILADGTTAGYTLALPTAVGIQGRIYIMKKVDATANIITIDASGTQTIDGALTQTLTTQYQTLRIQSDNANWVII